MMKRTRPAGNNERRCIVRDVLGLYGSIITIGTYRSQDSKQDLTKGLVFKALKRCVEQHPTLSTIAQDSKTEKPQLLQASQIDLNQHVFFLDPTIGEESNIQGLLERAHNEPLSDYETRPQWRLHVTPASSSPTKSTHVAFATSHALADGMSGLAFHKTFLEALHDSPFTSDPVFSPPTTRALLPALEAAGNLSISWSFLLGPLVGEYAPAWLARILGFSDKDDPDSSKPWTGAVSRPARPDATLVKTAVHVTPIPPEILARALAACKVHQARLTGLLNHFACRALARNLHVHGGSNKKHSRFVTETAIDLRRCLPAEFQGSMGNFVSAVTETVDVPSSSSLDAGQNLAASDWEAIGTSTQRLAEKSKSLADQPTGLLKYLSNYREWTVKKASIPAEASFGMSNLGTFDGGSSDAGWVIDDMVFSQSADATGAPFNLNVASGKHGSLMLVVTWQPGMFGLEDESLFVRDTMRDVRAQLEALS